MLDPPLALHSGVISSPSPLCGHGWQSPGGRVCRVPGSRHRSSWRTSESRQLWLGFLEFLVDGNQQQQLHFQVPSFFRCFLFCLVRFFLGTEQASGSCIFLEHLPNRLLIESLPVVPYRHLKSNAESSIMDLDLDPHKVRITFHPLPEVRISFQPPSCNPLYPRSHCGNPVLPGLSAAVRCFSDSQSAGGSALWMASSTTTKWWPIPTTSPVDFLTHRIHGFGIFTYMNGWFYYCKCR